MRLKGEEREFIAQYKVKIEQVFDAKGMSRSEYQEKMKKLNALLAINVSPCRELNHTMRIRSGHCAICNPKGLEYLRRESLSGFVYLAHSEAISKIKIGESSAPSGRLIALRKQDYGEAKDWKIRYFVSVEERGRVERQIKTMLKKYRVENLYYRNGSTEAREVFNCSLTTAKRAIEACTKKDLTKSL